MPPAVVKIIGAATVAVFGFARVFWAQLGGDGIPYSELIAAGGSITAAAFLLRMAIAGIRGVKHGEDEWTRKENEIQALKDELKGLRLEEADRITQLATAQGEAIKLRAQLDALKSGG